MAFTDPNPSTKIHIKNLTLPHPVVVRDVWGTNKEQPALLNISVTLCGSGFASAAKLDKLDESTIHYGTLAKKLRARHLVGMNLVELVRMAEEAILEMGEKSGERHIVLEGRVEVSFCKATMFGEEAKFISVRRYTADGNRLESKKRGFEVKDVKVMVLVGVNNYERQAKQPLVIEFGLWFDEGDIKTLFELETAVVDIIQDTTFETLETLVEHTVLELRKRVLDTKFPGSQFHLQIAKPRAIAFADAPIVDIIRNIPSKPQSTMFVPFTLCIRKPYA